MYFNLVNQTWKSTGWAFGHSRTKSLQAFWWQSATIFYIRKKAL